MSSYEEMLKRLRAYRKSIGLRQRQIGEIFGVSQELYSYIESGTIKITDDNLKALFGIGLNVDYLLTGKEYDYTAEELDSVLDGMNGDNRKFAVKLLAEVMVEKAEHRSPAEMPEDAARSIRLLAAALQSWDNFSMVNYVREDNGCSQLDMVQKLGIGIKKYREIERENRYPDAELLLNLYNMSGYQPMLFMNIRDRKLLAVKMIWSTLGAGDKRDIIKLIKQINKII